MLREEKKSEKRIDIFGVVDEIFNQLENLNQTVRPAGEYVLLGKYCFSRNTFPNMNLEYSGKIDLYSGVERDSAGKIHGSQTSRPQKFTDLFGGDFVNSLTSRLLQGTSLIIYPGEKLLSVRMEDTEEALKPYLELLRRRCGMPIIEIYNQ